LTSICVLSPEIEVTKLLIKNRLEAVNEEKGVAHGQAHSKLM
jgi:hypothetical protein